MEISNQVLNTKMKAPDGEDTYLNGNPLTIRIGLALAANQLIQGRSPEDTMKAGKLFNRIREINENLHLEAEEVAFLKQMAAASNAPSIYMQLYEVLEPGPEAGRKEDP